MRWSRKSRSRDLQNNTPLTKPHAENHPPSRNPPKKRKTAKNKGSKHPIGKKMQKSYTYRYIKKQTNKNVTYIYTLHLDAPNPPAHRTHHPMQVYRPCSHQTTFSKLLRQFPAAVSAGHMTACEWHPTLKNKKKKREKKNKISSYMSTSEWYAYLKHTYK